MRPGSVAVVDVAVGRVPNVAVEVVPRALAVEVAGAVGDVPLAARKNATMHEGHKLIMK